MDYASGIELNRVQWVLYGRNCSFFPKTDALFDVECGRRS